MAIARRIEPELSAALGRFPAVTLLGPREVGKTTPVLQVARTWPTRVVHLDLERPSHAARLRDAELYLEANADALIVIDEVQRMRELVALLRALIDASRRPGRPGVAQQRLMALCRRTAARASVRSQKQGITSVLARVHVSRLGSH